MTTAETNNDDWSYPCSDEEVLKSGDQERDPTFDEDEWAPPPAELEALFNTIETTGTVQLVWRCPGRRKPAAPVAPNTPAALNRDQPPEKSNFDFMDEMNSLRLRVRREGEDTLRGSAKKKTSSFDGIVSNMMRHKRLQQMEMEADNAPTT